MDTRSTAERIGALLDPPQSDPPVTDGYVDLLPPAPDERPSIAQRAMRSSVLPRIYERAWRPLLFRAWTGRSTAAETRLGLDLVRPRAGETALDVACGPGNTTRRLREALGDGLAVGCDASASMLARAVRDSPGSGVGYVRADAEALPFADASFDVVTCYGALYLMERPFRAVDELLRVLRPGGRIALLTTCDRGPAAARTAFAVTHGAIGLRGFAPDAFTSRFASAGLVDVRQEVSWWSQTVAGRRPEPQEARAGRRPQSAGG
jgi:SAM-dependent methyltransferase